MKKQKIPNQNRKKKEEFKNENSIRDICTNFKHTKIHMGVAGRRRERARN